MSRAADWEEVEITLRHWLDDDEAVSVLQVLQAVGWKSPQEVSEATAALRRELNDERQLRVPLPPLPIDAGRIFELEADNTRLRNLLHLGQIGARTKEWHEAVAKVLRA